MDVRRKNDGIANKNAKSATYSATYMACSYFVNILCMAVLLLITVCEHGIIAHGDGRFPGGARGLQSRCEARRTSWVCSIRTHLRHKQLARSVCGLFCVVVKLAETRALFVLAGERGEHVEREAPAVLLSAWLVGAVSFLRLSTSPLRRLRA